MKVQSPYGLVCFLLNIFVPGVGSMLSGCLDTHVNGMAIFFGFVQLISCWLIIGWMWSIYQGYLIYDLSVNYD